MDSRQKAYDPKLVETKWYSFWNEGGYFKADPSSKKPPFSIAMPPPNVTGVLHMGHALVGTVQDVLIRWKRMSGFEALWVPGTDHAGISTQAVVEKNLYTQTGKRRKEFSREEFLSHIWAWKERCEGQIISQLQKLGCSCDWSRLRFTMDEGNNRAVRVAFKKMFDDQLIYRGDYLIHWDPVAQTALSDDEVEHEERQSFLWHIRYPIVDSDAWVVIATTRPETLFGDSAVAVNPKDERYVSIIGKKVRLPLTDRLLPIIADPCIDSAFGTGAVKVTPAHDFDDFEIARRHQLPLLNLLTPDGKLNERGGAFANLSIDEARIAVVHALQQQGFLERVIPHISRVGVSYRSKAVIQPYISKQWFIRMSRFKEMLLSSVRNQRVQLIPSHWESVYFHWIEHLRDWCISRQLWWGHRIPIWHGPHGKMICWDDVGMPPEAEKDPTSWIQDPDVLDTWFSAGLWPFSMFHWPDQNADLKMFYPTSVLVTGHDILFFWVSRMILMGEYLQHAPPFHQVFLHGLIYGKSYWKRNEDGSSTYIMGKQKAQFDLGAPLPPGVESKWEKMSKSKGNIIDPLEIIEEYGTDALRMTLCASLTHARQIDLDKRRFEEYKNFANKIWNGARFVFLHLEGFSIDTLAKGLNPALFSLEDRWILSVFNRTIDEINGSLSQYTFDRAATRAYEFFWNDFCSMYLEMIKPILFGKTGTEALKIQKQKILVILLLGSIRLLHPMTPFITEELFYILREHFDGPPPSFSVTDPYTADCLKALQSPACIVAPYPQVILPSDIDPVIEKTFSSLIDLVRSVRNIRTEMQISPAEKTDLYLFGLKSSAAWTLAEMHQNILLALTPTTRILLSEEAPSLLSATRMWGDLQLMIPIPESLKAKEKERLKKEQGKLEKLKESTETKLANVAFRSRAPKEIVEKLESTLLQIKRELIGIEQKLR